MLHHKIQDDFGRYYRLHAYSDGIAPPGLKPKQLNDPVFVRQFIRTLRVSDGYWRHLINFIGSNTHGNNPHSSIEDHVCKLMILGKIKTFDITDFQAVLGKVEQYTFKGAGSTRVQLLPASAQLMVDKQAIKRFGSCKQAYQYLDTLGADEKQLQGIVQDLPPGAKPAGNASTLDTLAQSLMDGNLVVAETETKSVRPKDSAGSAAEAEAAAGPGNQPVDLGPHADSAAAVIAVASEALKEDPICSLLSFTVSSQSGREVLVNSKSKTTPKLALVATETQTKGFKSITAEILAEELCGSHQDSSFKVSKEHTLKSKSATGIALDVSCDPWNINNAFERVWLPSVRPKTYKIATKPTCQAPNMSITTVEVDVYPDIVWHWETQINFGQLEFVPGKAQVKYSDLAINGNVKLTYDGESHDLKEKYDEYITKPLEGFKKICDSISTVLEAINDPTSLMRIGTNAKLPPPPEGSDNTDGNETKLTLTWPNLDIKYDASLTESSHMDLVDHDYSISIAADPLLDIDIQIDVLDTLMKVAPAGTGKLIKYAKERIEEGFESDGAKFRGELDIIFKAKSTINITEGQLSGNHNVLEHDVSGEPIKGDIDIPVELKGVAKVEGKWFFITFDIDYSIRGQAGWKGKFEFGKDGEGVYCTQSMEFTGIVVTFTKYGEVKAEIKTDAISVEEGFGIHDMEVSSEDETLQLSTKDGSIEGNAAKVVEKTQSWSWLQPEKDEQKESLEKFYLIRH